MKKIWWFHKKAVILHRQKGNDPMTQKCLVV